jgi:hypothetical protein
MYSRIKSYEIMKVLFWLTAGVTDIVPAHTLPFHYAWEDRFCFREHSPELHILINFVRNAA